MTGPLDWDTDQWNDYILSSHGCRTVTREKTITRLPGRDLDTLLGVILYLLSVPQPVLCVSWSLEPSVCTVRVSLSLPVFPTGDSQPLEAVCLSSPRLPGPLPALSCHHQPAPCTDYRTLALLIILHTSCKTLLPLTFLFRYLLSIHQDVSTDRPDTVSPGPGLPACEN